MPISIGDAIVKIFGDDSGLQSTLEGVGSKLQGMGTKATAMGGIITAGFGAAVKTFADTGDELAKLSIKTGFSTESLSEWRHAADLSGSSIGGLEKSVKKMGQFLEGAKDGMATATDTLGKLGLKVEDFKGKGPEATFEIFAAKIAAVEDPLQRATVASQVFGKAGTDLLPLFASGADGMASMRAEAHELGLVFSQEAATASEEFNDNVSRLGGAFVGLKNAVAAELLPILIPMVDKMKEAVVGFREWVEAHPVLFENLVKFTALVGGVLVVVGPIIVALGTLISSFGALVGAVGPAISFLGSLGGAVSAVGSVLAAVVSPIGLAVAAIVSIPLSIGSIVKTIIDYWDEIKRTTNDIWGGISSFFSSTWDGIKGIFQAGVDGIQSIGGTFTGYFVHLWDETKRIWGGIVSAILNPLETIKSGMDVATGFFKNLFGASLWPDYFQNLEGATETHFSGMAVAVDENLKASMGSMDSFTAKLSETSQALSAITTVGGYAKTPEMLEKVRSTIESLEEMASKASPNMVAYYENLITLQKQQEKEILESLKATEEGMDDAYGHSWFPDLLAKAVATAEKTLPAMGEAFTKAKEKIRENLEGMKTELTDSGKYLTVPVAEVPKEIMGKGPKEWQAYRTALKTQMDSLAADKAKFESVLEKALDTEISLRTAEQREAVAMKDSHESYFKQRQRKLEEEMASANSAMESFAAKNAEIVKNDFGDLEKSGGKAFSNVATVAQKGFDAVKDSVGSVGSALGEAGRVAETVALGTAKSFLSTAELISNSLLSIQLNSARLESQLLSATDLRGTLSVLGSQLAQRQLATAGVSSGGDFNVGGIQVNGGGDSFAIASEIRRQLKTLQQKTILNRNRG